MAHPLSGHLLNASALAVAAVLALAADRISAGPAGTAIVARGADALGDIDGFITPVGPDSLLARFEAQLRVDPFEGGRSAGEGIFVASPRGSPTVRNTQARPTRQLTAILVADNKRVAVVDDEVVSVGDVLRDGARVSRIQADRVFIVEKNGTWRTLTLASGRP